MEDHEESPIYPDPNVTFNTPYLSQPYGYDSQDYSIGTPDSYWPPAPAPVVHEGYVRQDDSDFDDQNDPSEDLRQLHAQYGLQDVLNPTHSHYRFNDDVDLEMEDSPSDDFDDEQAQIEELARAELTGNNPAIDPDFEVSEDEAQFGNKTSSESESPDDSPEESTRGRGSKRGRGRAGGRARGRRGYKWALKGTEHDPALKKARGGTRGRPRGSQIPRGEGRKKGKPKGASNTVEPNADFKRLQILATQSFLAEDLETAADYAREAVQTNPEIFAAHSLLSEVLLAQGKEHDSLIVLTAGAHTKRDPALWHHLAERNLDQAGEDRSLAVLESAIYCYTVAIRLDSKDYDARLAKLNLLLEAYENHQVSTGLSRAQRECKIMVKIRPSDLPMISKYAELSSVIGAQDEIVKAKQAFQNAIDFYAKGKTLGPDRTEQWDYLYQHVSLVNTVDGPAQAIFQLKRLSRWLLGRGEETFWDEYQDDDREFDVDDEPRRIEVSAFSRYAADRSRFGEGLQLDLRIKLGLYRLAMGGGHMSEACRHFAFFRPLDVQDHFESFREIGDALTMSGLYTDALQYYEPLQDVPEALDVAYYMDLAFCYKELSRLGEAEDCYQAITENNADEWEARVALAKMYEEQGRGADAVPLINEVIRMGRNDALKRANLQAPVQAAPVRRPVQAQRRERVDQEPTDTLMDGRPITRVVDTDGFVHMHMQMPTPPSDDENRQPVAFAADQGNTRRARPLKARLPAQKKEKVIKPIKTRKPKGPTLKGQERLAYLQNMNERIRGNWETLQSCRNDLAQGDEDALESFMDAANSMLVDFKNAKVFYPGTEGGKDRHQRFTGYGKRSSVLNDLEAMKARLLGDQESAEAALRQSQEDLPTDFHDINFKDWLDIFCEYALYLAQDGQRETCYETLQTAHHANIFYHDTGSSQQIHATWIACALIFNDEDRLTQISRWYMTQYPHSSGSYQIFAAVSRLFAGTSTWFNAGPTQKYLLRAIKAYDFALLDPEQREIYSFTGQERSSYTHGGKKRPNHQGLTELDPGVLAVYGHIMAAAQTWPSALNYYFRALALEPENVTINLCIGLAYIQGSTKRQSNNRHFEIMQGMAFLTRYKDIRCRDGIAVYEQEAEYNIARAWHLLGINHLAVKGYERCLRLAKKIKAEAAEGGEKGKEEEEEEEEGEEEEEEEAREEFTQEAASALVSILVTAGNLTAARRITETWLVI